MNIGFMGGSFDPVHCGHLAAAQDALAQAGLDRVVFVPAAQAPLKPGVVSASGEHRLAMLRLAVEGWERCEVSDYEIRQGGVNYTVDTVRHFRAQFPQDTLYWIIGTDQLARLGQWREIELLAERVEFIVRTRPGYAWEMPLGLPGLRARRCDGPAWEISSTELRSRLARGEPVDAFMPHKTIEYVRENLLYR